MHRQNIDTDDAKVKECMIEYFETWRNRMKGNSDDWWSVLIDVKQ